MFPKTIKIKSRGEMAELPVGNIVYAESRQHQVCIHLKDGESHVCYGSLSSLRSPYVPWVFCGFTGVFLSTCCTF